jgi:hypothetical protein
MKINKFFQSKYDPENVPAEWWFERFRNWRAEELKATDFTQLPDVPVDATAWAIYRQALRDLPAHKDFTNAELPQRPN